MKQLLVRLFLPVTLSAAACGGDSTEVDPSARVRFFNATMGMTGSGGFTTNGSFAGGSSLPFGQSTQTCAKLAPGTVSIGFGNANSGGTALSGEALATLSSQGLTTGGNYTVAAAGSAATPMLFLLDNSYAGSLGSNQVAVRFVNLAPGTTNLFTVFTGVIGGGGTLTAANIDVGAPTPFNTIASGSNAFTILNGHDIVIAGIDAMFNLQGGTVNTLAIIPNTTPGTFRLINIPRCS